MNQAISAAITIEMRADESVVLVGEDVAAAGGVFKASEGLLSEFCPSRVVDTLGAGPSFGAQHSQTPAHWVVGTPGLKVVMASGPSSAFGLIRAAIRDPDPVVVVEPRSLYATRGDSSADDATVREIGTAYPLGRGDQVTLVAAGASVQTCLEAPDRLGPMFAEVIDLSTLYPWDSATVLESVHKTRRLVLIDDGRHSAGWSSTVGADVGGTMFDFLLCPPSRVTSPVLLPVPFAAGAEDLDVLHAEEVVRRVASPLSGRRATATSWEPYPTALAPGPDVPRSTFGPG